MALGSELLVLAIYMGQQLGVMLGVGAETVLLVAFLIALHKGEADDGHQNFTQAVRMAQGAGLGLIILTGIGAVLFHASLLGDPMASTEALGVLLAPAFLFKWALIGIVTLCFFLEGTKGGHPVLKGFAGGSWFALFLVHSLAPITTWLELVSLYVAWLIVFSIIWATFVFVMRHGQSALEAYASRAAQAPAKPAPPPVPPRPAPQPIPPPAPPVVPPPPPPVPKPVPPPPPPPPKPVPPPPPPIPKPIPPPPPPPPAPKPVPPPPPPPKPVPPPPPVPKPVPPPIATPKPIVVPAPMPVMASTAVPAVKKESWWARLLKMFEGEPHTPTVKPVPPAPQPVAALKPVPPPIQVKPISPPPPPPKPVPPPPPPPAPKPIPPPAPKPAPAVPTNLPVVEHLLLAKAPAPVVPKPVAPVAAPKPLPPPQEKVDLPTLHIMPQRPEDLHLQYRFDPIMKPKEDVEFTTTA